MSDAASDRATASEVSARAALEDGAELAVLVATRPVEVVLALFAQLVLATLGLVAAGLVLESAAGWVAVAGLAAAYVAAVSKVSDAISPQRPEAEPARRLASDVVVTRDGQWVLTPSGREKVDAYRRQVPEPALRRRWRRLWASSSGPRGRRRGPRRAARFGRCGSNE